MAAIGFTKLNNEGRYANGDFEVWGLVPRNVLKDNGGDIFIIDAEIKVQGKVLSERGLMENAVPTELMPSPLIIQMV